MAEKKQLCQFKPVESFALTCVTFQSVQCGVVCGCGQSLEAADIASTASSLTSCNFEEYHQSWQSSHLKESFFRDMEDTTWFEEKSDDEKLTHLSQLMYSDDENAKEDFERLLNLVPVDLVFAPFDRYLNF